MRFFSKKKASIFFALAFLCVSGADSWTQTSFQYQYGNYCPEEGFFGATVVQQCPDEGFIYVGYTESTETMDCQNRDVYVVRTDNLGAVTTATVSWEKTYDIGGLDGWDSPHGMIEVSDGSGFVIVGTTDLNNPQGRKDIFLMKLDCDGNNLWTVTYGLIDEDEYGYDVFEARTGNTVTTNAGDFIVAGSATHPNDFSGTDAYIMRVNSAGALIWENRYTEWPFKPDIEERFYSLTDVEPTLQPGGGFQTAGDIIAVGEIDVLANGKNGYVVRVDGNNGTINTTPPLLQGAATFGGCFWYQGQQLCYDEKLLSVVELQNPAEKGLYPHVVISGYTNTGLAPEIYLIKLLDGDPNASMEMLLGDGWAGSIWDRGTSIREIRHVPGGGASYAQWDLALTGMTLPNPPQPGAPPPTDAILLGINPTLLTPTGTLGMQFGTPGDHEEGWSIDIVPTGSQTRREGFFIGGTIYDYPQTPGPFDVDLYMLKTNRRGSTQPQTACEEPYNPSAVDPQWTPVSANPFINAHNPIETLYLDEDVDRDWGEQRCTAAGKSIARQEPLPAATPVRNNAALKVYPQPLSSGEPLTLEYMPMNVHDVEVTISNALGVGVYSATVDGRIGARGRFAVSTAGWATGAYVVEIRDGDASVTASVVITR